MVAPTTLVIGPRSNPITRQQLRRVSRIGGVQDVTAVDAGRVRLSGRSMNVFGVDPSTFRSWSPPRTASSNDFWRAVTMDKLAVTFEALKQPEVQLGRSYSIGGRRVQLAAVAGLGLPMLDGLVNRRVGRDIGLVPRLGALINAPAADGAELKKSVRKLLGKQAQVFELRDTPAGAPPGAEGSAGEAGSANPLSGKNQSKPSTYKELYVRSAKRCSGLSWTVLAAIGQVESAHGRNVGPSSAGALGPMQFIPQTWRRHGFDADGDGKANVMNPYDAVPSAARYLCAHGAGEGRGSLRNAIYAYNHAWWYVRAVLNLAERYEAE